MDAAANTIAPCGDPIIGSITIPDPSDPSGAIGLWQCTICGHVYCAVDLAHLEP